MQGDFSIILCFKIEDYYFVLDTKSYVSFSVILITSDNVCYPHTYKCI